MQSTQPSSRTDFRVGIICALPTEYNAVCLIFDEFWNDTGDRYGRVPGDRNQYTTGRIGKHDVVLALLPRMGTIDATSAAIGMRTSYSALQLVLLVGICGAVPFVSGTEILLGDVIVSKSVVWYDYGRQYPDKFVRKDTVEDNLRQPNSDIRGLLMSFETDRGIEQLEEQTAGFLQELQTKAAKKKKIGRNRYKSPGAAQDVLYENDYRHKHRHESLCACRACEKDTDPVCDEALGLLCSDLGCEKSHARLRDRLSEKLELEQKGDPAAQNPVLHIGAVASAATVLKSAAHRDSIAEQENVIAFEMEGAGVWEAVPCLIVKGACDYADSHKHKEWQDFAAATAASAAKAILQCYIQTDVVRDERSRAQENIVKNIRFGDNNSGNQTGINYGSINNTYGRFS